MKSNISECQAWSLYEAKQYAEAAQIWENLLQSTPTNSGEHTKLMNGYVYALVGMKRFDEARKIHRDSYEKFKDHIDLHQLAFVEREAGDYEQALKHIHDERGLISAEEWTYLGANSYELGKLNELLGNLDLALEFSKQCEEESKRSSDLVLKACAQRLLGDIYSRFGKLSAALSHFEASKKFFEEAGDPIGTEEIMNTIAKYEQPL
jgi:tetratricopeptide (TPR) repeat protein